MSIFESLRDEYHPHPDYMEMCRSGQGRLFEVEEYGSFRCRVKNMGLVGPTTRHGLSCRLGPNLGITTSAQLGSNMGQLGHARTQVGFNMRNLVLCGDNGLARWKYIVGNSGEKRMFSELSLQNWPGLAPAWPKLEPIGPKLKPCYAHVSPSQLQHWATYCRFARRGRPCPHVGAQLGPKLLPNRSNLWPSCGMLDPSWVEVGASGSKLC